jgi:hypothetical protein
MRAEQVTLKFPNTLPEIKPATSHLVAQCLNQMHHRSPDFGKNCRKIIWTAPETITTQNIEREQWIVFPKS